ncbi:MAG: hypothetical protein ACI9GK_000309 [Devosia sp.]|jgi:hypothetical protein
MICSGNTHLARDMRDLAQDMQGQYQTALTTQHDVQTCTDRQVTPRQQRPDTATLSVKNKRAQI